MYEKHAAVFEMEIFIRSHPLPRHWGAFTLSLYLCARPTGAASGPCRSFRWFRVSLKKRLPAAGGLEGKGRRGDGGGADTVDIPDGVRMPGCQGARIAECEGVRVRGCQGVRVPRFEGVKVRGCQGSRV